VTGSVSYDGGIPTDPPDGNSGYLIDTSAYEGGANAINNIAGYDNMPVDALIGVFLGPGLPTSMPAPSPLNFGTTGTDPLGTNFASLSPGLQQILFIGDGLTGTGSGSVQTFTVRRRSSLWLDKAFFESFAPSADPNSVLAFVTIGNYLLK
jgi:hypothetical protein